jgi:hypothetical protein
VTFWLQPLEHTLDEKGKPRVSSGNKWIGAGLQPGEVCGLREQQQKPGDWGLPALSDPLTNKVSGQTLSGWSTDSYTTLGSHLRSQLAHSFLAHPSVCVLWDAGLTSNISAGERCCPLVQTRGSRGQSTSSPFVYRLPATRHISKVHFLKKGNLIFAVNSSQRDLTDGQCLSCKPKGSFCIKRRRRRRRRNTLKLSS